MRSRRMPALFTRMSTRPKASSAAFAMRSAFCGSAMDRVLAKPRPPARAISSTTACAGAASEPAPSRLAPTSFTTTPAPSCASASAIARPMPRPAPVTIATFPATMPTISAPHLFGHLDDGAKLRPLLVLGQHIAFFARREAALRAEAQLREVDVLRGLVDAPLDGILRFELAGLGGDQAEHHRAVLRHQAERLEPAGALGVVFHEVAVHLDAVEQDIGHRLVAARTH